MGDPGGKEKAPCSHEWERIGVDPLDLNPPARGDVVWECKHCGGEIPLPLGERPGKDDDPEYNRYGNKIDEEGNEVEEDGDK